MSFHDATSFAALATELASSPDEQATAEQVVARALDLSGVAATGLSACATSGCRTVAASDERSSSLEDLQHSLQDGPHVRPWDDPGWTKVDDLDAGVRWPRWGAAAGSLGLRSALAVGLGDGEDCVGTLTLYGEQPRSFDDDALEVALTFALHARSALATARVLERLRRTLRSRHTLGMAQGIAMERLDLDADGSLRLLLLGATRQAKPLDVVTADVLATRELPA